jgi:hypothetical protein
VITKQGNFKRNFLVIFEREQDLQNTLRNFNPGIFNEPTVRIQEYIDMSEWDKEANIQIDDV